MMKPLFFFSVLIVLTSCVPIFAEHKNQDHSLRHKIEKEIKIIEKPIIFDEIRKQLSREYIKKHYGIENTNATIVPNMIVIHATEIETLSASFSALKNPILSAARANLKSAGLLNVSAHFLIDRDGTIYRLLPETIFARHTIGLNLHAIGIENVGGTPRTPFTKEQLEANIVLVRYIASQFPIKWLIAHSEYGRFRKSKLWLEKDPTYFTYKSDPGSAFMLELRKRIKSLALAAYP